MDGMSMDIEQSDRDKLRVIFPQCFVEGKLDIDKLLNLCGEYITDDFEKYEFKWKGKSECLQLAQRRSTGTLRPCVEESVNFDTTQNLYIEGDNLEVLKLLQTSYYSKVKMIYIDPPYNTGNDFVYNDNFKDPIAHYKEVTSQATKSNPETMGRFHTAWLNMMYPRLRLAANLLRDDGFCFISIDDNEVGNLRKLCDEVFGEENFIAQIIWQKKYAPKSDSKYLSESHDYILMYAKSLVNCVIKRLPKTEKQNARYKNIDNDPRGPWKPDNVLRNEFREYAYFPVSKPNGEEVYPPTGTSWRYSKEKFAELIADNRIWFGKDGSSRPAYKRFLSEVSDTIPATTLWLHEEVGHNDSANKELRGLFETVVPFDTPKPSSLIKRMLEIGTYEDSIVVDFFSGSATTAHAVMQLNAEDGGNRRFIMVQLPEVTDEKSEANKAGYKNICEIGKERIRRAGAKVTNEWHEKQIQIELDESGEQAPPDVGFRVFKLDTSNLKIWDNTPIKDLDLAELERRLRGMLEVIKDDRSNFDVVYEVMLKLGQDLCEDIVELDINGKAVYGIGKDITFIICLAPHITPEDAELIAEYTPGRIIFSEQCFDNTTDKSNVKLTMRDRGIIMRML